MGIAIDPNSIQFIGNSLVDESYRGVQIDNPDGTQSSERTITIGMDDGFYNIPSLYNGIQLTEGEAIEKFRKGEMPAVGYAKTMEEAVKKAGDRSKMLGREGMKGIAIDPSSITNIQLPTDDLGTADRVADILVSPIYEQFKGIEPVVRGVISAIASLGLWSGAGIRATQELIPIPTISPDPDKPLITTTPGIVSVSPDPSEELFRKDPERLEKANKRFEEVMGFPTKLIKSPEDVRVVENLMLLGKPFEWAGKAGGYIGYGLNWALQELGVPVDTYLEPILATTGEAAAVLFGPKLIKTLKNSTVFRRMTVKQRGLMLQSLAETAKRTGLSEGALLREHGQPADWVAEMKRVSPEGEVREVRPDITERHMPPIPEEEVMGELGKRRRFAEERTSASEPTQREYLRPEEKPFIERTAPATPGPGAGIAIDPNSITDIRAPSDLDQPALAEYPDLYGKPPEEVMPELETRGRMREEHPSYGEPPPRTYLRPEEPALTTEQPRFPPPEKSPAIQKPTEAAPREQDVMRELKKRMGYDDLGRKVRQFSMLKPEQQAKDIDAFAEDVVSVFGGENTPKIQAMADAAVEAMREANVPSEIMNRLEIALKPSIKLKDYINKDTAKKNLQEHLKNGTLAEEAAGMVDFLTNGKALVDFSLKLKSPEALKDVAWHEVDHLFRKWLYPDEVNARLDELFDGNREKEADGLRDFMQDPNNRANLKRPNWLRQLWTSLRNFLTRLGDKLRGAGNLSADDIFKRAVRGVYKPRVMDIADAYSEASTTGSPAPVWHSKLVRAVEDGLPNTGSGKQIISTLNSWAKKGRISAEELEWSDLPNWLSNQEGKVTKQELLDYLDANHVKVIDVIKGRRIEPKPETTEVTETEPVDVEEVEDRRDAIQNSWEDGDPIILEPDEEWISNEVNYYLEEAFYPRDRLIERDDVVKRINEEVDKILEDEGYDYRVEDLDRLESTPQRQLTIEGREELPGLTPKELEMRNVIKEIREDVIQEAKADGWLWDIAAEIAHENWYESEYSQLDVRSNAETGWEIRSDYEGYMHSIYDDQGRFQEGFESNLAEAELRAEELMEQDGLMEGEPPEGGWPVSQPAAPKTRWEQYTLNGGSQYEEWILEVRLPAGKQEGRAYYVNPTHWGNDVIDYVVHIRTKLRIGANGERILAIEEIQTDPIAEGRAKGFTGVKDPEKAAEIGPELTKKRNELKAAEKDLNDLEQGFKDAGLYTLSDLSEAERTERSKAIRRKNAIRREVAVLDRDLTAVEGRGPIPDFPFKKTAMLLGMKRMVRRAVDEGYDIVAWTPGIVHADRWNMAMQVNSIDIVGDELIFNTKERGPITVRVDDEGIMSSEHELLNGHPLDEAISPEIIAEIEDLREEQGSADYLVKSTETENIMGFYGTHSEAINRQNELAGQNLPTYIVAPQKVTIDTKELEVLSERGKGKEDTYEKVIPYSIKKFFGKKAWGNPEIRPVKIVDAPGEPDKYLNWSGFEVTDEMKAKSTVEGISMFQMRGRKGANYPQGLQTTRLTRGTPQRAQALQRQAFRGGVTGRAKEPAVAGTTVQGATYQGFEIEGDPTSGYSWIDNETGLPFTTDTPDPDVIANEVKRLRSDEIQFSTFDKSREPVNVQKPLKQGNFSKVRDEFKKAREAYLDPNTDSPLDKAGAAQLRTGKFADYIREMPDLGDLRPIDLFRQDPNTRKLVAKLVPKSGKGKTKPAMRQSGYYVSQRFVDAFADWDEKTQTYTLKPGIKDVNATAEQTMDPTRFMQSIDQGFFGGPVQQYVTWPLRMTTMAKLQYADQHMAKLADTRDKYKLYKAQEKELIGDLMRQIHERDAWASSVSELLKNPEIAQLLTRYSGQRKGELINAAKQLRIQLTQIRREMNMARRKRKQPEIQFVKAYVPDVLAQNLKSKLLGTAMKPDWITSTPEMPDFIQPNQPFNPRALPRSNKLDEALKEKDIIKLMADYIKTASKDIYDTNIIHNNKIHAAALRSLGMHHAADGLERLTSEIYGGVAPWVTRGAKKVVGETAQRALYGFRRNLTRAVFPLNFSWNTFIQTSSSALTMARYGPKASVAGLQYLFNPEIRQAVKQNAYSMILKSRWGGKAAYQDIQGSILKNKRLQQSKLDTVEEYANFLTSTFEDLLTGHAVTAAYYKGRKLGLTGRALWEYASEGGAKTQSMYDFANVPGLLRNKEISSLFPFQTFAFDVFNTTREMKIPLIYRVIGTAGTYESIAAPKGTYLEADLADPSKYESVDLNSKAGKGLLRNRLKGIGLFAASLIVLNAVGEKAIGRKPWVVSSFLPFLRYIVGSSWGWAGAFGMGPEIAAPQQYMKEFQEAIYDIIHRGSWRRARKWTVRYHAPAGIQINRMIDGIVAVSQGGEVRKVNEQSMYKIDPDEYWKAILLGPSTTEAGKEYIRKLEGKESKKEEKPKYNPKRKYTKPKD